jgi:hypothetical protein
LASDTVLDKAIQTGLNSDQYFAFASGFDGARYRDLKFNQYVGVIERSGYLVKVPVAKKQLDDDEAKRQAEAAARAAAAGAIIPASTGGNGGQTSTSYPDYTSSGNIGNMELHEAPTSSQPPVPKNRRFFMSADLNTTRINRDVQKYLEEIIQHLTSVNGARVKVSLEVEAEIGEGFSQQTVRTISENCRTLQVRDSGFEE